MLSVRETDHMVFQGTRFLQHEKKMLKKLYNFQNDFYRKEHFWMFNEAQSPPAMNIKGRPHVTIKEPGEG